MPNHIVRENVYAINIVIFPDPKKHPNNMKQYKRWFGNFDSENMRQLGIKYNPGILFY
jgi:hypothetical protein